jgi:sterol desaturase/sphingolipid hydroxylase (fatty acid hydroxylase superfamily)
LGIIAIETLHTNALNIVRLCGSLVLLIAVFVPLERLFGLHRQRIFRRAFGTDVVYYFLSGLLPKLLLTLPLSLLAGGLHRLYPNAFYQAISTLPVALRMFAALVVGEIGYYWAHRWAHEIPFLWRFHAIHHSAEEIDWLVNTKSHPVDALFTRICGQIPLYCLGLAQPLGQRLDWVPFFVPMVGTFWGFFIHANVNWRLGWLEWLVSTPAFHHWHHTNDGADVINKNYSTLLPWIDKCFGTFYLPKEWPASYGIDEPVSGELSHQLLDPLLAPRPDQDGGLTKDYPVTGD